MAVSDLATGPTRGTLDRTRRVRGHFPHVVGLHGAAELAAQFVSAGFDHGVVRDTHHRTVCAIQGNRDSGGLAKQLIELLLKRRRRIIHESASAGDAMGCLKCQAAAL